MFPGCLLYLSPRDDHCSDEDAAELFYALEFLVPFEAGLYVKELWKNSKKNLTILLCAVLKRRLPANLNSIKSWNVHDS
jgi:hypothetical protein